MPAISFSVLKDKLLFGEKRQTIRRPRKRPLQVGDTLYVYWKQRTPDCQKLGTAVITSMDKIYLSHMPQADAIAHRDGFNSAMEMFQWFAERYVTLENQNPCFDVIRFEPDWVGRKKTKYRQAQLRDD